MTYYQGNMLGLLHEMYDFLKYMGFNITRDHNGCVTCEFDENTGLSPNRKFIWKYSISRHFCKELNRFTETIVVDRGVKSGSHNSIYSMNVDEGNKYKDVY